MALNWLLAPRLGADAAFLAAYPPTVLFHFCLNKWWTFRDQSQVGRRQVAEYLLMTVVMIMAAGSTLDSTFASVAKSIGQEVPMLAGRKPGPRAMVTGMWTMIVFALLGNIPMIAGTDILKATTISGTMVMGLAPIFLLAPLVRHSPWSFHLAFWPGILLGVLLATGMRSEEHTSELQSH